ncbi:MAG: nucleotidyltransferase domain-containing protein [Pseudomonadales bacterium]
MSQLGEALFTTTQRNVLALLYGHPDRSFYTREIIRRTGMGVATIKRELDRMQAAGILTLVKIGNQHHYQANTLCPIYAELLAIVRKTFGIADVIAEALVPIDAHLDLAFVYGSLAKGTESSSSDIDLMLVGDSIDYADVIALLMPLEESLQRPIHPTIYLADDFRVKLAGNNSFLQRVMDHPKLMIKGLIDEYKQS